MSRNASLCFRLVLSTFVLMMVGLTQPANAQNGGLNSSDPRFTVAGTSIEVNITGARWGDITGACPLSLSREEEYKKAFDGGKAGKEPDGCPFFADKQGDKYPLAQKCGEFYTALSKKLGTYPNSSMSCCHMPSGPMRQACVSQNQEIALSQNADVGRQMKATNTTTDDSNYLSAPEAKEIEEKKQKKKTALGQCFEGTMERVGKFWAAKQEVRCVKSITRLFSGKIKEILSNGSDRIVDTALTTAASTGTAGSSPGPIAPIPSPYGVAGGAIATAKNIINLATRVSDIADQLDAELADCQGIIPGLRELSDFRKSITSNLSCQALSSLLERQLTQCVRVNLSVDLRLPQFALLLQCPININIAARLTPQGFDCYNNISAGSPVVANFGGRSILSGNGGLENLFNGGCFKGGASGGLNGNGSGSGANGESTGARIPGIDCGPLDTSTARQSSLQGMALLAPGRTTNGWAVGGSETVSGQAITRCDYYESGRLLRTNYVYGSGSSCNAGASGFLQGGYETNTACYRGGYTAAAAPSIPDACMYPNSCLDNSGQFSESRRGQDGCPANVLPVFNPNAVYSIFTSGGLNGGNTTTKSCADFSDAIQGAVMCCDPQKQDCTKRDANVPLCQCDEGDAMNRVIDPVGGSCEQGGKATCCSPRLNGAAWCNANTGTSGTCASEKVDQCKPSNAPASYTDPAGNTRSITAADMALSKPSPFIYLFVRPDVVEPNGQQCCMTEWCNVCPQQYANAYALSLARSAPPSDLSESSNRALLGKGWPYISSANDMGVTSYQLGVNPLNVTLYHYNWASLDKDYDKEIEVGISNPILFMSNDVPKPLDAALNACNSMSGWKATYGSSEMFSNTGGASMGFIYDQSTGKGRGGKEDQWRLVAPVPSMKETPLAYLNRIRAAYSNGSVPLEPIALCSDKSQICLPGSNQQLNTTTDFATPMTPAPVTTPAPKPSVPVEVPSAGDNNAAPATAAPTQQNASPTVVPSAGNGQASGELY